MTETTFMTVPVHVGLIPDGIRRWSKENKKTEMEAYLIAMKKIDDMVNFIFELGTKTLSVYVLSKDNLKRSPSTLETIFSAESLFFRELLPLVAKRWKAKVTYAGNLLTVPSAEYRNSLLRLAADTSNYSDKEIILLAGYDPIDELNHAVNLSKETGKNFIDHLWIKQEVDMLIRTGKETRISKFLPLQSSYAELFFINKLYPDVELEDIKNAFDFFKSKNRRYGA